MNKCLMFDLDGTLAESKSYLSNDMAVELHRLAQRYTIAIITGGSMEQIQKQVITRLKFTHNFVFLPTSGAQLWDPEFNQYIYSYTLDDREIAEIYRAGFECLSRYTVLPDKVYGPIAENRAAQVTFSLCGQNAPVVVKREYNQEYDWCRRAAAKFMQQQLSRFEVRCGGLTSIDVTKKGIDKGFGVTEFMKVTGYDKRDITFFGDQLMPGGNDQPVAELGIICIEVTGPQDTLEKLRRWK